MIGPPVKSGVTMADCEILFKLVDAVHSDPVKDKIGCYKAGDPVVVFPSGHEWGASEGPPLFFVVRVLGLSAEEARKYIVQETLFNDEVTRRRAYGLRMGSIPNQIKSKINKGFLEIQWSAVRSYIENKITKETV